MVTFRKIIVAASVLLCCGSLQAQPHHDRGEKRGCFIASNLPGLNPEQTTKIEPLELAHLKKIQQLENALNEQQAHLQTLETADVPSLDAINKQIDAIGGTNTSILKERAAFRQQIRALLNDKQKIVFDMEASKAHHRGMRGRGGKHRPDFDENREKHEAPLPDKQ